MAQRRPTKSERIQIGDWVGEQLKKYGVWVVLMPNNQFDKPLMEGLEFSQNWRTVYMDDKQRLLVDVTSPKGEALFQGIFNGKTVYPDDYSAKLTAGNNLLLFQDPAQKKKGLELLIEAMNTHFAPAPMIEMLMIGSQFDELQPRIDEVCEQYVKDFDQNAKTYGGQNGYNERLEAIRLAFIRLEDAAKSSRNTQAAAAYDRLIDTYEAQRERILATKRW
jgi:hypothetical protein